MKNCLIVICEGFLQAGKTYIKAPYVYCMETYNYTIYKLWLHYFIFTEMNMHENKSLKNIKYIWSLFMMYTCTKLT